MFLTIFIVVFYLMQVIETLLHEIYSDVLYYKYITFNGTSKHVYNLDVKVFQC